MITNNGCSSSPADRTRQRGSNALMVGKQPQQTRDGRWSQLARHSCPEGKYVMGTTEDRLDRLTGSQQNDMRSVPSAR